jgi:hypothetical protein
LYSCCSAAELFVYERICNLFVFRDKELFHCVRLFSENLLPQLASCSESISLFEMQHSQMTDETNKVIVLRSIKQKIEVWQFGELALSAPS